MSELDKAVAREKELGDEVQALYEEQWPLQAKIRKLRMKATLPLISEAPWRIKAPYHDHEAYRLSVACDLFPGSEDAYDKWFERVLGVLAEDGIHNSNEIRKDVTLSLDDNEATIIVRDADAGAAVIRKLGLRLVADDVEKQIEKHRRLISAKQALLALAQGKKP